MICLTGDVHHELGAPGQAYFEGSEPKLARIYAGIAEKHGIKVTLFITGKAFVEDEESVLELSEYENVEIGGHTWSAFRSLPLHNLFKLVGGSVYGPRFYQRRDIRKTLDIINEKTGERAVSWRTHAYGSNQTTIELLEEEGIKVVSDEVSNRKLGPKKLGKGLISLPINVMPDHEHLYYGARTEERVKRAIDSGWSDAFTSESFTVGAYFRIIKRQIEKIESKSGVATLLLHPFTMKVCDDFKTFERLCAWIQKKEYETIWCREAPDYIAYEK
jgi:peptidoglycan/xylan/chitin deacetylase (PgdA/CDA1 family)